MNHQRRVNPGTTAPAEERSCSRLRPWLFLISALVIKTAVLTIFFVAPFSRSNDQPTALQEKFTAWECNSAVSQGKGWTCCPKGWKTFQKSCYFLSTDFMSWIESEQNCTEMGSHLVVINSREEQDFLYKQINKGSKNVNFYIGLRAESVDQWQWVDKTPYNVTAAFWRKGEPSHHTGENCVVMHVPEIDHSNWNDVKCEHYGRICEAAAVTV